MSLSARQSRWACAAALGLACALIPAQAGGAVTSPAPADELELPDRVDLPDGWQPEGITARGKDLFVGSLLDGAIWRTNTKTGEEGVFVEGESGEVAVGLYYNRRHDLLWVAGGETGELRAYDADSGELLRTYSFPSSNDRFLNDIAIVRGVVYATDSLQQELAVVPLNGELPPESAATTMPLTGDLEYEEDFNLNGIVRIRGELLSVQSNTGLLFHIDRRTGETTEVDLGGELLINGDGLEGDRDDTVYALRNADNLVAVVEIAPDARSGEVVTELTDEDLDVPSTAAISRGQLWAVNARFSTPPEPATPYWITRLDKYDG